jgi:P-type Ca2+ transporter type 2C
MYYKKLDVVFKELSSKENGLSKQEAKSRLEKYGLNQLKEEVKISAFQIFVSQFKSFVVYILIVALLVSGFLGEYLDAIVILAILVLNAVLGFFQEYNAGKAIAALKKMGSVKAKVFRNNEEVEIDASELVPGDVVLLEEGDKINADSRIFESVNLETQESALTGESTPVSKEDCVLKHGAAIADRKNMAFSGTIVTKGRGKAMIVSTGMNSQIGKIAKLIAKAEDQMTPLQKKLQVLGKQLGFLTIIVCLIVFGAGYWRTGNFVLMLLTAIALAVAAIPEGLPIIVTICMSLGVKRMIKKNALVRKLSSVETLGSTTVICSDKTGTLTHNQMTVKKLFVNDEIIDVSGDGCSFHGDFTLNGQKVDSKTTKNFELLLRAGILCNNSEISKGDDNCTSIIGDPTEGALIVTGEKSGLARKEQRKKFPRVKEFPFNSDRKLMSTVHKVGKSYHVYTKGAPDVIVKHCNKIYVNGKIKKLDSNTKNRILSANDTFGHGALRVLGVAFKQVKNYKKVKENDLVFLGLQGMIDPPRAEAKEAIAKCKTAGIKVIMITGDHKITAQAIGNELGLKGHVMTGDEIDKCEDLSKVVETVSIFARVSPKHKMDIVEALRKNGEVIAMTGDGVNDAPALKDADIGIAMGKSGTEVAKEASAMVLMDDNFASIVNAVEEGRTIYDNIKKFVNYLLSANFGEVLVLFVATLIGFRDNGQVIVPLLAIQILWLNLVTDGFPALALGVDPGTPGTMRRPPRRPKEHIVSKNMVWNIVIVGILMCVAVLTLFKFGLSESAIKGQTMAFTSLVVLEMARVYMVRANYNLGLFSNKYLIVAILFSFMLQLGVVYIPWLQPIFDTVALGWMDWVYIFGSAFAVLIIGRVAYKIVSYYTEETD